MKVVFSDLDGTILDRKTYNYAESQPVIDILKRKNIPLILCSSKTRAEIELYQTRFGITDPFIVEDGGAIVIPEGYFPFALDGRSKNGQIFLEFGIRNEEIKTKLHDVLSRSTAKYHLFTEMTPEEISSDSGLSLFESELAKKREYSETLRLPREKDNEDKIIKAILSSGLKVNRGARYLTVSSSNNKGLGVKKLVGFYQRKYDRIETLGLGDAKNDESMFKEVDLPILVQGSSNSWEEFEDIPNLIRVDGVGPIGFRKGLEQTIGLN